ncbi:hypothetical protein [Streptomyces gobiensis]|uniref:hypothetical protein n=1 Tax=Streptomyces gobiensis TaxID=2875706 RepID=UPI001E642D94|nr:hypothetical protein [Streptomyces gobiensis]UGY90418.1 hypothetical protein test1122_00865 [Streptomyces gobiensis]
MLTLTICAALSAAGLAVSFLMAYRRRFVAATRLAAVSLLPIGLAMAGLVGLGGKVIQAASSWAADLVLKPTVWAGFAVLALSVLLYLIAKFAEGRSDEGAKQRPAVQPEASRPAVTSGDAAKPKRQAEAEDFSDIEAILKKHGI